MSPQLGTHQAMMTSLANPFANEALQHGNISINDVIKFVSLSSNFPCSKPVAWTSCMLIACTCYIQAYIDNIVLQWHPAISIVFLVLLRRSRKTCCCLFRFFYDPITKYYLHLFIVPSQITDP